jgi:hypothetical protein
VSLLNSAVKLAKLETVKSPSPGQYSALREALWAAKSPEALAVLPSGLQFDRDTLANVAAKPFVSGLWK